MGILETENLFSENFGHSVAKGAAVAKSYQFSGTPSGGERGHVGDVMIVLVRWTALIMELGGLYFTFRLSHEGKLLAALLLFLTHLFLVILFVISHALVEEVIHRSDKNRRRGNKRKRNSTSIAVGQRNENSWPISILPRHH